MTILCQYLHHRYKALPRNLSLDSLVGLAIVADKYDFVAPLSSMVALWLKAHIHRLPSETGLCDMLAVACLFDDPWGVKAVTAQLLMVTGENLVDPKNRQLGYRVPESVCSEYSKLSGLIKATC